MSAGPRRARELFLAALRLAPEGWDAYLEGACAGDGELRGRVRRLLEAHRQVGSFLETPVPVPGVTVEAPAARECAGAVIGPYRLLQLLGEGGMGAVFLAEQTEPVQRRVALKVIKTGLDSANVLAR